MSLTIVGHRRQHALRSLGMSAVAARGNVELWRFEGPAGLTAQSSGSGAVLDILAQGLIVDG